MGTAAIRRLALMAAIVLLAPFWCPQSVVAWAAVAPGPTAVSVAADGAPVAPTIRPHGPSAWSMAGARGDLGARRLLIVGVITLLSLFVVGQWSVLRTGLTAPSPLVSRRHAIALRAPPLPSRA